jgi:hypothetical protein
VPALISFYSVYYQTILLIKAREPALNELTTFKLQGQKITSSITRGKNNHFRLKNGYFSRTQRKYIQNLQTSLGYIFLMLQQCTAELCNFDALSSYGNGFRSSCLDQNFISSWNHSLLIKLLIVADC